MRSGDRVSTMSDRLVGIAIGVALGVGGALLVIHLLGDRVDSTSTTATGSTTASSTQGSSVAARSGPDETAALRTRVAELEATVRELGSGAAVKTDERRGREPDSEHGMTTDPVWWEKMPHVPTWDQPREQLVIERLGKLGVKLDATRVECRKRCCRLRLTDEVYDEHLDEITSSVGLGIAMPAGRGTSSNGDGEYFLIQCWQQEQPSAPIPDRAIEREALLAKIAGEIKKCGQGVSPAVTLKLWLEIDEDGQIAKVQSNKAQLGSKAAACAETAILAAAGFAPSPMSTSVPITVVVGA